MALALLTCIRRWLINLNLFETGRPEIEAIRHERWSTRIYIILHLGILYFLVIYKGLGSETSYITVKNPSQAVFESLAKKYPDTLNCPCSTVAIKYQEFVQIRPTFHQVCSSSFITQEWIVAAYETHTHDIWPMDFRTVSSTYAQLLRSFCSWSRTCLDNIINSSLTNSFINPQALSATILKLKVNEQIDQNRFTGPWLLTTALLAIRHSTTGNQLMSGLRTDSFIYMQPYEKTMASVGINTYETINGSKCYCYPTNNCTTPAAIYLNPVEPTFGVYRLDTSSIPINGMQTACYPLEGLLASSLECYFDSSCLQLVVPNSTTFIPLNSTQTSRFSPNTTVDDLISELMVEQWSLDIHPEDYYTQCAPLACTYSYPHRNTFLSIITTIVSILGGLNTALRLIVPRLTETILKLKNKFFRTGASFPPVATPLAVAVRATVSSKVKEKLLEFWTKIKSLNLFDTDSGDPLVKRREQKTTRLYILLFSATFIVLFFYTTFTEQTKIYNVEYPTQATYEHLLVKYADTIQCPCTLIAIPYQEFISVNVNYHPICSSEFISDSFIAQLFVFRNENVYRGDFMQMSGPYFAGLGKFCLLSKIIFSRSLGNVQSNLFINDKLLSPADFAMKSADMVTLFVQEAAAAFEEGLQILLEFTTANQMLSVSSVSYNLRIVSNENVRVEPGGFYDCSCLLNPSTCSEEAGFYSYNSSTDSFTLLSTVMGIRVTCFPLLSIVNSNLACWYSLDCYNKVIEFWQNKTNGLVYLPPLLKQSSSSSFDSSTPLSIIIDQMMIEQWSNNISYSSFFTQCNPQYCTYMVIERSDIIVIVTTLIGILSGLHVALTLLAPLVIHAVFWFKNHVHGNLNVLQLLRGLPSRFLILNLFYNRYKSSALTLKKELHATRLYILLFSLIFTILVLYNSLIQEAVTVTVHQPTQTVYEQLVLSFGSTLQCPCSRVSISYSYFLQISVPLHQVCSSPFVQTVWIENIFGDGDWSNLTMNEFRSRGGTYFVILQTLCSIAQQTAGYVISGSSTGDMVSKQCIPEMQLAYQIISQIDDLRYMSIFNYVKAIQYARDSTYGNQLLSVSSSNWVFSSPYAANTSYYAIPAQPVSYGSNCSCATSSACTQPVFVNGQVVPGFVLGCFPLESIFRSTLVCLYNQTCLDQINIANLSTIRPLDASLPSEYWSNTTVDELVANVFMEKWSYNVNYTAFFSVCNPSICSYVISQPRNPLQTISILLGLYGGLTAIIKFAAPYLIAIFRRIVLMLRRRDNAVIPLA